MITTGIRVTLNDEDTTGKTHENVTNIVAKHTQEVMSDHLELTQAEKKEEIIRRVSKDLSEAGINATVESVDQDFGPQFVAALIEAISGTDPKQEAYNLYQTNLSKITAMTIAQFNSLEIDPMKAVTFFGDVYVHMLANVVNNYLPNMDANDDRIRQLLFRASLLKLVSHAINPHHVCAITDMNVKRDEMVADLQAVIDIKNKDRFADLLTEYATLVEAVIAKNHNKVN